ncbi:MAG: hypothetical protein R3213_05950 [Flavobacteriaceae bacterium]|nr:hypothetical protein [Flavobacteriaceae bacterium]
MEDIKFDINENHKIDNARLSHEFRWMPVILFHYGQAKAEAQYQCDLAEARYKEAEQSKYFHYKSDKELKYTDKQAEAAAKSDAQVIELKNTYFAIKKDVGTLVAYLESLRAKKDMLIQLGADARKE